MLHRTNYLKLIQYDEVRNRIVSALSDYDVPTERVPVDRVRGRVCAEEIRASKNFPDRPLAAMDGYAIHSASTRGISASNPLSLVVEGSLFPGSNVGFRLKKGHACYTATGASIPLGADAVVRVEEVRFDGKVAQILRPVPKWKNIFLRGEDYQSGQVLLRKRRVFNSADVALLISLGRKSVKVFRTPKVGILSVGDELALFGSNESKTKTINNYSNLISGFVSEQGAEVRPIGICPDDQVAIAESLSIAVKNCDVVITIGGSSVGAKDLTVKSASSILNSSPVFHGVAIVPVRPTALVMVGRKPVVILPANAVSAAASFFMIALPILNIVSGLSFDDRRIEINAKSSSSFKNDKPISALYLVNLKKASDGTHVFSSLGWGSNQSYDLAKSNGFVILLKNQRVSKNEELKVTLFGASEMSRICEHAGTSGSNNGNSGHKSDRAVSLG